MFLLDKQKHEHCMFYLQERGEHKGNAGCMRMKHVPEHLLTHLLHTLLRLRDSTASPKKPEGDVGVGGLQ